MTLQPVILDFDGAVLPVANNEVRLPLADWQERLRFGCTLRTGAQWQEHLNVLLANHLKPDQRCCAFTGSGDYHHVSLFLLRHLARQQALKPASLDLIVCDNHPDNMRYPFGLHCGSWVHHAAKLPAIRHIHVIGITSADICLSHAWENALRPFWHKKLTYWSISKTASWLTWIGRGAYGKSFATADTLINAFLPCLHNERLYLSIDKDVFTPELVRTNWDQGVFRLEHLKAVLTACAGRLAGADITGDVSSYVYQNPFKNMLSRLDGQSPPTPEEVRVWQFAQQKINKCLLQRLV